jgi:hypothetical protein
VATSFPCRLFVIMARTAARAVIFRRGPGKRVQQILWDTAHDTFTPGQWFHGRIYVRRCDLSPDGSKLIYFAIKGRSELGTWTAISNVPYFTALALWPNGTSYGGGGLFVSDREILLNDHVAPFAGHELPPSVSIVGRPDGPGAEDLTVYYPRLRREGWSLVSSATPTPHTRVDVWEKVISKRGVRLRKRAIATSEEREEGKGCYYDEHSLVSPDGEEIALPRAEWADVDHAGRLVDAKEQLGATIAELANFNAARPARVPPPESARRW